MIKTFQQKISDLQSSLIKLVQDDFPDKVNEAAHLCFKALSKGLPLLVCGNGGSAADAQHIAGELVGQFLSARRALNVKALNTDTSIITAWANDVSYDTIFSRQVEAYGAKGGVLLVISTSGNSRNIIEAVNTARSMNMAVIGLTGESGGKLTSCCNISLNVPATDTPRIQEMHIMVYHYMCEVIENLILLSNEHV